MKKFYKVLSVLLVLSMVLVSFSGCSKKKDNTNDDSNNAATVAPATPTTAPTAAPVVNDTPLVVGYDQFSSKFSPFFCESVSDQDVANMTGLNLMTTDRVGGIIYNSIEGETVPYNGKDYNYKGISDITVTQDSAADTTTYDIKIRDDIKFSDGQPLTADDIIFTYYVLSDPSYDGGLTLYSMPIIGMTNYRANSSIADTVTDQDIADMLKNPTDDLKKQISDTIIRPTLTSEYDWCKSCYGDDNYKKYTDAFPVQKDLFANFYNLDKKYDSTKVTDYKQVIEDIIAQYGADYKTLASNYAGDDTYFDSQAQDLARTALIAQKKAAGQGADVSNIAGITKISDTEVQVVTKGFDATAIYQIGGIIVAPLHYYGDPAQYDYANNKFGFPRGDLSIVKAKTTQPLGAGPYKFVKYENKVVFFEANENYYSGAPKIKYMQFKEVAEPDKVTGIQQGTLDIANPSNSKTVDEQISGLNSNGTITGDKISTSLVDNLGYGYIGINSSTVNVGGVADSDASKDLRKALATIISVYRDVAIDTFYGPAASVINYPISNTSWAAPQKSDSDYQIAYSADVNGNPIYTADMTIDQKHAAALQAAIGFLEAAGYTVKNGVVTAAPDGAKLDYEIMIIGNGTGDHPSFAILTDAAAALKTIGINLNVNDLSDQNVLWDKLNAGTQDLWCAAWQATIDPDMYQTYYSTNAPGLGGTNSNYYHIADKDLDTLIMDARKSADQTYRKAAYKQCLDIILNWGVEIPIYQRQNCIVFSTERVNMDTMTPDITTFYNWYAEIQNIELK